MRSPERALATWGQFLQQGGQAAEALSIWVLKPGFGINRARAPCACDLQVRLPWAALCGCAKLW
ncbi:MAG: hypothetical protein U0401_18970 [Anaerolineae bacterium]